MRAAPGRRSQRPWAQQEGVRSPAPRRAGTGMSRHEGSTLGLYESKQMSVPFVVVCTASGRPTMIVAARLKGSTLHRSARSAGEGRSSWVRHTHRRREQERVRRDARLLERLALLMRHHGRRLRTPRPFPIPHRSVVSAVRSSSVCPPVSIRQRCAGVSRRVEVVQESVDERSRVCRDG